MKSVEDEPICHCMSKLFFFSSLSPTFVDDEMCVNESSGVQCLSVVAI